MFLPLLLVYGRIPPVHYLLTIIANTMRTLFCSLLLVVCATALSAQSADTWRTISVTGSSSMTLTPDIIPIEITLKEYYQEEFQDGTTEEDYKTLVPLADIQRELLSQLRTLGIPDSSIKVASASSKGRTYWSDDGKYLKSKKPTRLSKEFIVTVGNFDMVDRLFRQLDMKGIDDIDIRTMRHSKEHEYRKQMKIAALKAAQEKAQYLVEAVGSRLGSVINIDESPSTGYSGSRYTNLGSNTRMSSEDSSGGAAEGTDAQKITIRYEIGAIFEIK